MDPRRAGQIDGEQFFFGRDGEPIDVMTWANMYEDIKGRTVKRTRVYGVEVATVWLGTNDEFDQPPLIYGSMALKVNALDGTWEIRTSCRAEAEIAHQVLVDRIRTGAGPLPLPPAASFFGGGSCSSC